jgi:heme/copper-type cytochrome/quinol oxidase subunit 1
MPPHARRAPRDRRAIAHTHQVSRHLWWILGLALVAGGVVLVLAGQPGGSADFGWTAYSPLDDSPDWRMSWGDATIVSRWQLVGGAVAAVGLMVVTAGIGFRLGQRRATRPEHP